MLVQCAGRHQNLAKGFEMQHRPSSLVCAPCGPRQQAARSREQGSGACGVCGARVSLLQQCYFGRCCNAYVPKCAFGEWCSSLAVLSVQVGFILDSSPFWTQAVLGTQNRVSQIPVSLDLCRLEKMKPLFLLIAKLNSAGSCSVVHCRVHFF